MIIQFNIYIVNIVSVGGLYATLDENFIITMFEIAISLADIKLLIIQCVNSFTITKL